MLGAALQNLMFPVTVNLCSHLIIKDTTPNSNIYYNTWIFYVPLPHVTIYSNVGMDFNQLNISDFISGNIWNHEFLRTYLGTTSSAQMFTSSLRISRNGKNDWVLWNSVTRDTTIAIATWDPLNDGSIIDTRNGRKQLCNSKFYLKLKPSCGKFYFYSRDCPPGHIYTISMLVVITHEHYVGCMKNLFLTYSINAGSARKSGDHQF